MSVQSWLDQDVSEVADLLAKEAVARRLVKEADLPTTLRDFGTKAMDYASDAGKRIGEFGANFGNKAQEYGNQALSWLNEPGHEGLRHGLAGAGIGGLLGLGSQFARDPEDRQYGSSALSGALAGGAIGGGLGMMRQFGGDLYGPKDQPKPEGTPDISHKIEDLNQQISQHEQGQAAQQSAEFGNAARQGGLLAGGVLGTDQFLQNRPSQLLQRGAGAAELSDYGPDAQAAIRRMRTAPGSMPLNRSWLSAYIDPQLPHWNTTMDTVPDANNPLGAMLGDATDLEAGQPGTRGQPRTTFSPGRFFAQADDANRHIPHLTNAEVRRMGSLLHNGQLPSAMGRYGAIGLGLLPLAANYLGGQGVHQQQQDFAQGLSGGSN